MEWNIKKLDSNKSLVIGISAVGKKRTRDIFIPAGALDYGTYLFNFTIRMTTYPTMISSKATYVTITYSSATANLVKFGTSIITNSYDKPLILDPGSYSEDPDAGRFNAHVSDAWSFI